MKEKCDNCGEIEEIGYEFRRIGWMGAAANYRLKFCYKCGEKIEKILEDGVN